MIDPALMISALCVHQRTDGIGSGSGGTWTVEKEASPETASAWDTLSGAALSSVGPGPNACSGCRKQPRTSPPHCRRPMPKPAKHSAPSAHQKSAPASSRAAVAACLRAREGERADKGEPPAPCVPAH